MDSILKASASGGDDGCKMPKGQGSPSVEEADQGGNHKLRKGRGSSSVEGADKGGEVFLKKGPWTQAEDAILREYVEKHGEGNWNAVQKNSGLARCGKSCRLRWANHLRPNLKKGAFTAEEEQRIVELHASMGNKWAKMAVELPGRTDNEIKNFWNTRVKRRKRASQTTYPEEVEIYRPQVPNVNLESLNPDALLTNEAREHDSISQIENFDISDVEFSIMEFPPCIYDPSICMPMTVSDMLAQLEQSTYSTQCNMLPMMHPSKRLRGSDMIYNCLNPSVVPTFDQYDPIFSTSDQFGNDLSGSHVALNDNISTFSDPIYGAFKVELPSIQCFEARNRIWHTQESSLPPLVKAVDTPESSTQFQPNQSVPVSHQNNDGLLESVLYCSKNLNGSNNLDSFQENDDNCILNEAVQNSTLNPSETQWDEQEILRSSLGPFVDSVLADYTNIPNCIFSMETTEDHGDKNVGFTQFPDDSSGQENLDPLEFLLNPEPSPDLSFIENLYFNGDRLLRRTAHGA